MVTLEEITLDLLFSWFLIFSRIGSALAFIPGFGDGFVPVRVRLLLALISSIALTPVLQSSLPTMPTHTISLMILLVGEITLGCFIGVIGRLWLSSMHLFGMIVSTQMGLASALLFDPSSQSQGATLGVFLTMLAILLVFATGTHHLYLQGLVDSYHVFVPGSFPAMQDLSSRITDTVAGSFLVAFKLSSPFIVMGILLNLGSGVISRLMPSMQVFFIIMPVQIVLGFLILFLTLSASMLWYINVLGNQALDVFTP